MQHKNCFKFLGDLGYLDLLDISFNYYYLN
jgi:hypothetical protein